MPKANKTKSNDNNANSSASSSLPSSSTSQAVNMANNDFPNPAVSKGPESEIEETVKTSNLLENLKTIPSIELSPMGVRSFRANCKRYAPSGAEYCSIAQRKKAISESQQLALEALLTINGIAHTDLDFLDWDHAAFFSALETCYPLADVTQDTQENMVSRHVLGAILPIIEKMTATSRQQSTHLLTAYSTAMEEAGVKGIDQLTYWTKANSMVTISKVEDAIKKHPAYVINNNLYPKLQQAKASEKITSLRAYILRMIAIHNELVKKAEDYKATFHNDQVFQAQDRSQSSALQFKESERQSQNFHGRSRSRSRSRHRDISRSRSRDHNHHDKDRHPRDRSRSRDRIHDRARSSSRGRFDLPRRDPCDGCGNTHPNPFKRETLHGFGYSPEDIRQRKYATDERIGCFFKAHPDFNFSNRTFQESEIGRHYHKNKKRGIQSDLRYSVTHNQFVPIDKKAWVSNRQSPITLINNNNPNPNGLPNRVAKRKLLLNPEVDSKPKAAEPHLPVTPGPIHSLNPTKTPKLIERADGHTGIIKKIDESNRIKLFQFKISINNYSLPILNVKVERGNIVHRFKALVDTGATDTVITNNLAAQLNIPVTYTQPVKIELADGTVIHAGTTVLIRNVGFSRPCEQSAPGLGEPGTAETSGFASDSTIGQSGCSTRREQLKQTRRERRQMMSLLKKRHMPDPGTYGITAPDIKAIVLHRTADTDYDMILGFKDVKRLDITRIFRSMFQPNDIERLDKGVHKVSSLSAQTTATLPEGTEPSGHGKLYSKNELLDPLPDDDDDIDRFRTKSHWEKYFDEAQAHEDIREFKPTASTLMTVEQIVDLVTIDESLSLEDRDIIKKCLHKHRDRFAVKVGKHPARIPPFEINVKDNEWASEKHRNERPRPQSMAKQIAIRKFIQKALADGIIRPSNAEYFSQVLLTPKANGDWRFCVDYRRLNALTKGHHGWPLPNIESMLLRLGSHQAKYFATLDYTSGYHQAELSEASRKYTAFCIDGGVYEWCRVPMGPKGAPSYFQYQMQNTVFKGLTPRLLEIYIDDLITWGNSIKDLAVKLDSIFETLRKWNLTVNPEKCKFGLKKIEYVGHLIDEEGMTFSEKKLNHVGDFELPNNQKKMKSFLGLVSYFRNHVHHITEEVQPLQDMVRNYKPRQRLKWTPELIERFHKVKQAVIDCPKLYFPQPGLPIHVQTDASDYGIGAYLFQMGPDSQEKPLGFISKSLNDVQRRWSTFEKEAYAIFYALRKWDHHLRDVHFTLETDHKNLIYLNKEASKKVQRWKLEIQEYDFTVKHIPGKLNIVADGMSRHCNTPLETIVNLNAINAHRMSLKDFMNELRMDNDAEENDITIDKHEYWDYVEVNNLIATHPSFHLDADKWAVLSKVHNSTVGHGGVERTINKLNELFTKDPNSKPNDWTTMRKDVTNFIRKCPCCQKMEVLKKPIQTIPFTLASYGLFDRIAVDTIGPLPDSKEGHKYILVIIDSFSRWIELLPIPDTTAITAADALLQFVGRYGVPCAMLTDNGTQFVNQTVEQLSALLNVDHIKTHAYSHEENGIVERANKEVMRHLRAIMFDKKVMTEWSKYLPFVQRIMNSSVHSATQISPMTLIYGHAVDLNRGLILPYEAPKSGMGEYIADVINVQRTALRTAMETQYQRDLYQIQSAYKNNKSAGNEPQFPIDSYVLVKHERGPPSKLHPILKGPMRVVNIKRRGNQPTTYVCEDLITHKYHNFHVKNLKPFEYDSAKTDPETVAMTDDQTFLVESILKHRFIGDKSPNKTNLQFLIKWIGYKEPTWEPYRNTSSLEKVHNYLLKAKLKKFIPEKYKETQ